VPFDRQESTFFVGAASSPETTAARCRSRKKRSTSKETKFLGKGGDEDQAIGIARSAGGIKGVYLHSIRRDHP
jgi:hypothetical protein